MNTDPTIVEDLRRMLLDGATPSRLVRYVVERTPPQEHLNWVVQKYFQQAFFVFLRGLPIEGPDADFSNAGLNHFLLHSIVEQKPNWIPDEADESWLNGLEATDRQELNEQVDLAGSPELAELNETLDDTARKSIQRSIGSANGLYQLVRILAALAERLQHKIDRLEAEIAEREPALT